MILSNTRLLVSEGVCFMYDFEGLVCVQTSAAEFLQGTVTRVYLMQEQTCLPNSEMRNKMFLRRIAENRSSCSA